MDSASTFIRRKKASSSSAHPSPVVSSSSPFIPFGGFFAAPSSYPAQAPFRPPHWQSTQQEEKQNRGFLPPTTQNGGNTNMNIQRGGAVGRRPATVPSLQPQQQQHRGMDANRLAEYYQQGGVPQYPPYPVPPRTAATGGVSSRTHRLPPDSSLSSRPLPVSGRSQIRPQTHYGPRPTALPQGYPPQSMQPHAPTGFADDAARARATLIDRERRQIFSYLSSPNTFLFSSVSGPVGLTEEDLDLLLAAGSTSTWTLLHLKTLDRLGKRFTGFEQLIPAVAALAAKQTEENRRVLTWLTGPSCSLFGGVPTGAWSDPSSPPSAVLLSQADVERLVIESQAGLETLKHLHAIQHSVLNGLISGFENFQQLIHAVREVELAKQQAGQNNTSTNAQANRTHKANESTNNNNSNTNGNASNGPTNVANPPHPSSSPSGSSAPFSDVDGEERRLVLEFAASPNCGLFSQADAVVATAGDLDALIAYCGNAALVIEQLMQFDQNQIKFLSFGEILPALKELNRSNRPGEALRPLLTQTQIEENRSIAHAYLSSNECMLFSEKDEPVQATGRDFDNLVFAAGGDAQECVRILKQLDSGHAVLNEDGTKVEVTPIGAGANEALVAATPGGASGTPNGDSNTRTSVGMKFQSFASLVRAVDLTHAANLAASGSRGSSAEWSSSDRESVLNWLSSTDCQLFSDLAQGEIEVHLKELDLLLDLGHGRWTLTWLHWLNRSLPQPKFRNFQTLLETMKTLSSEMKTLILPKLSNILIKASCPIFHAPTSANGTANGKTGKTSASRTSKSAKKSKSLASGNPTGGPGSGSMISTKLTLDDLENLVYLSGACSDILTHIDMFIRDGRSFGSLRELIDATREAQEDQRALAFVSDLDRQAIIDFLSKENCVLFVENDGINGNVNGNGPNSNQSAVSTLAASHPGAPYLDDLPSPSSVVGGSSHDIHVRKSDLDRLIVEGRGVNMCLFHLSGLNAAGRQFQTFTELLPAVREAQKRSMEEKEDLLVKLLTHRTTLFPSATVLTSANSGASSAYYQDPSALVTTSTLDLDLSHAESLYIDGGAGGQTSGYIDIFLDTGAIFEQFDELIVAVKDLHGQVLRNKYACYLMERSERLLTPQERRNIILSYLYSHDCTLFSDAEDVNVSDEDLDLLQIESGGGGSNTIGVPLSFSAGLGDGRPPSSTSLGHTLLFLKYIDWSGRKFQSFTPLKSAVRDCYLAAVRQKKGILDYLRAHAAHTAHAIVVNNDKNLLSPSGGPSQQSILTHPVCKLLSASAPQLQRTLDARDIERLFLQGSAGPTTMSYLLDLEDQGLQFTSLDSLIHAVRLAHSQSIETRKVEKNILLSFLGSPSCSLLSSPGVVGGVGPAAGPTPLLKQLSDMELVTLLNIGKGGVATLFFMHILQAMGKSFTNVADLISGVKELKDGHTIQRKKEIATFLKSERCHLLRDLERTPINQALIDRLYVESSCASTTLLHLWLLNVLGYSFSSVESLISSLKASFESSFTRGGCERGMLLVGLVAPGALVIGGGDAANSAAGASAASTPIPHGVLAKVHGVLPVFWLKLTNEDIEGVINMCENGANAMRFICQLARSQRSFTTFPDLLDALHQLFQDLVSGRRSLLAKLTNVDDCTLFHTSTPGVLSIDVHSLTLSDMDLLVGRTQDPRKTMFLLEAFEARRSKFHSFGDLVSAVQVAHWNTMASIRQEKSLIYLHLTSPTCSLLPPGAALLDPELDQLFLVAGSAKGTLFYLNQLESRSKTYPGGFKDLFADVMNLHSEACRVKEEVAKFFAHPGHKLLQSGGGGDHAPVSGADIDRLYSESGAGVELVPLLNTLEGQGLRFVSMAQIISAVRSASLRQQQQTKEDRLLILSFLSRPACVLFKGPVQASPKDIDSLILAGGGPVPAGPNHPQAPPSNNPAQATLEILKEMESSIAAAGTVGVDSFADLISSITSIRSGSLAHRAAVLAFLTSPRCFLFKDSPHDIVIDSVGVDRLFLRSGAGKMVLDHLKSLSVAGGRFGSFYSFDELIQAVRNMHQQTMAGQKNATNNATTTTTATAATTNANADGANQKSSEEMKEQDDSTSRSSNPAPSSAIPSSPSSVRPPAEVPPSAILSWLHHPSRRLFSRASEPVTPTAPDVDRLLEVSATPELLLQSLKDLEIGGSIQCEDIEELIQAVQSNEARRINDRKMIIAFMTSGKCHLFGQPLPSNNVDPPSSAPFHLSDLQLDQLYSRGGAGMFTLRHLHELNDSIDMHGGDAASTGMDFDTLLDAIYHRHHASIDTLRSQKQMIRTYLASHHSELMWVWPHPTSDAAPIRHRITDMDLNQLILEGGGTGASLLRHLHKLDEVRLNHASTHPNAPRKSYHTILDMVHAVRDLNHHELHAKRELLEFLNSASCPLWSDSAPGAHSHAQRASIHDVDKLFDGTHAHFDTPLILWIFEHAGRKFHSAGQLIDGVREARIECQLGSHAEVLTLVAHLASAQCTLLPHEPFQASMADLIHLLQVGGGGSATLFELFELESVDYRAASFDDLIHRVGENASDATMPVKTLVLEYLTDGDVSHLFAADADRLEDLFSPAALASGADRRTDSLAQLPVTSSGVSRMVEEGGCALNTLEALKSIDRTHVPIEDLRKTVYLLLDRHEMGGRFESLLHAKRMKHLADKQAQADKRASLEQSVGAGLAASLANASAPAKPVSRWTDQDRDQIVSFLSHPDTLLFSESTAQLEVSARLLDQLLDSCSPSSSSDSSPASVEPALLLLKHLNLASRKMADLADLINILGKEYAALESCAKDALARLTSDDCALWTADTRADVISQLSEGGADLIKQRLLVDTDVACMIHQRLDELELNGSSFASLVDLAAALSDGQSAYFNRVYQAKESLLAHLSEPDVSSHLFSNALNMNDVDLWAMVQAGRAGGFNCIDAIEQSRRESKFESIAALIAAIRAHTAVHEQALLSFLHTPNGSSLLAQSDLVLPYLSSHLLSTMTFLYGAIDAGAQTTIRAKELAQAGCTFNNVQAFIQAMRNTEQARSDAHAARVDNSLPSQEDISALVEFLQLPSTLLFADSSDDLSIEPDQIGLLFAACAPSTDATAGWSSTEPHLRALNEVHRRFTRFEQLAQAITAAQEENQGAYADDEQLELMRESIERAQIFGSNTDAIGSSEAGAITRDAAGAVIVTRRDVDELLRLIPVNPDSFVVGSTELADHIRAFGSVGRRFSDWLSLHSALSAVAADVTRGHLSEADLELVAAFFTNGSCTLLAADLPNPTGAQIDQIVHAAGGVNQLMTALARLNDKQLRLASVDLLIDEVSKLPPVDSASAPAAAAAAAAAAAPLTIEVEPTHTAANAPSQPPSAPIIPHISPDDQTRLADFLSQSQLFASAGGSLEITVESLDALAFECGSVPDLLDLLKGLDRSLEQFSTFEDLQFRVRQLVTSAAATGPVGEEPKPTERKSSINRQPQHNDDNMQQPHATLSPVLESSELAPAVSSDPPLSSSAAVLSDSDRDELVSWLGSPSCLFFSDSTADLSVTVEELDELAHVGGGVKQTIVLLTRMSIEIGLRFAQFNQILPALKREVENPTPVPTQTPADASVAAPAPVPAPVPTPAADSIIAAESESQPAAADQPNINPPVPIQTQPEQTPSEPVEPVHALESEATSASAPQPQPVDSTPLPEPAAAPAEAATATEAAAPTEPAATQPTTVEPTAVSDLVDPVVMTDDERGIVVGFLSESSLFLNATDNLEVDSGELDLMKQEANGSFDQLMAALKEIDEKGARPMTFKELFQIVHIYWINVREGKPGYESQPPAAAPVAAPAATSTPAPAPAPAPAAPAHSPQDADELVEYISSAGLFSEATDNLSVESDSIDALIHAAGGVTNLIRVLQAMDRTHRKFMHFDDLHPAVLDALDSNSHIGGAASQTLVEYLSGEECHLFAEATEGLEVTVEELDALVESGMGLTQTISTLRAMDGAGMRFAKFTDLAPAIQQFKQNATHTQ